MSKSRLKAMLIIVFDIRGIVYREYIPEGKTVTGEFYVSVLEQLRARVYRVRPEFFGQKRHSSNSPRFFLTPQNEVTPPRKTHHGGIEEVKEAVTLVQNGSLPRVEATVELLRRVKGYHEV